MFLTRVTIGYNEEGGWLLTIDGKGTGNSRFMYPEGLALDPQGNIHVAENHYIEVFTKEGIYVRKYGEFTHPRRINIDDEGNASVIDDGRCLYVFDHYGNKIHHVRNFEEPVDIALDPRDGSVFVANWDANSVLKYSVI